MGSQNQDQPGVKSAKRQTIEPLRSGLKSRQIDGNVARCNDVVVFVFIIQQGRDSFKINHISKSIFLKN